MFPEQNPPPLDFRDQPLLNSIQLSEATSEEIRNILKYLKNGAPEYDQINASWLNHIASFINEALR